MVADQVTTTLDSTTDADAKWTGDPTMLATHLQRIMAMLSKTNSNLHYYAKHGVVVDMKENKKIEEGPVLDMYNDQLFTLIMNSISNESLKVDLTVNHTSRDGQPDGHGLMNALYERLTNVSSIEVSKLKRDFSKLVDDGLSECSVKAFDKLRHEIDLICQRLPSQHAITDAQLADAYATACSTVLGKETMLSLQRISDFGSVSEITK